MPNFLLIKHVKDFIFSWCVVSQLFITLIRHLKQSTENVLKRKCLLSPLFFKILVPNHLSPVLILGFKLQEHLVKTAAHFLRA